MLLSTAFFPPVSWFAAASADWGRRFLVCPGIVSDVYIEAHENFSKQSYRNRCIISSAGGCEFFSVPIVHEGDLYHKKITDVMVDYSVPWVRKFEKTIDSAYKTSAFFEHYRDDVFTLLEQETPGLWDLNLNLIRFFSGRMHLGLRFVPTDCFTPFAEEGDYRVMIHPKRTNTILRQLNLEKPYFQVFSGKYGFQPDLSVMDLLFNEGPDSILYVVSSESPT